MMYIIVLLVLALLVVYLLWRWLSSELGEAGRSLRVALRVRRGGRTPQLLAEEARAACRAEGIEPDLVIVSHDALDLYDRLRERVIGRTDRPDLPGATVLALAADADAGKLYVRAVETPAERPGREIVRLHDLDRVARIEAVTHAGPEGLVAPAEQAIAIAVDDPDVPEYRLAVEPGWHIAALDITRRLSTLCRDREPPRGAPVVVR